MIALSTPWGRRGWFWEVWSDTDQRGEGWARTMIRAQDCPRIKPAFLEKEKRRLGEWRYAQEYECEFLDPESSVFTSELIARALVEFPEPFWSAA
jgi:hypothetical protein